MKSSTTVKRLITFVCLVTICLLVYLLPVTFFMGSSTGVIPAFAQQADACAKAPAVRLKNGDKAKIVTPSAKEFPGAFLKAAADRVSPVLRYLPVGAVVEIVDGPKCGPEGDHWFTVKLGDLTGFMAEANGKVYALEPFTSGDVPDLLPSTIIAVMDCIGTNPNLPTPTIVPITEVPTSQADSVGNNATDAAATTQTADTASAATESATAVATTSVASSQPTVIASPTKTGNEVTRVVFANETGDLMVSDDGSIGRTVTKFNPVPLSIDLSPDGAAALVVTLNGLYWVDLQSGNTLMVADAQKFALQEGSWIDQVRWLPDQHSAAVEVTERKNGVIGFAVWLIPLDGTFPPYRVDVGAQPAGGIVRSPVYGNMVMISANDISPFPHNSVEQVQSLIEFVPRMPEGENQQPVVPAISWNADDSGFYTYIPISDLAPDDDKVGGHLWYVPLSGKAIDLGKPPQLNPIDYVIPSGDGQFFVAGHGAAWTIRSVKTGQVVQTLPPVQILFGWTPDNKGVAYRSQQGDAKFFGVDGGTDSGYLPQLSGLYDIHWLASTAPIYLAQGADKKLSLSVRPSGKDAQFLSIVPTWGSYNGRILPQKPTKAIAPVKCG